MPNGTRPRVEPDPPRRVGTPMTVQEWRSISFLHWRLDADALSSRLPPWLRLDTYDGDGWIGLVPFRMLVRPPVGPVVPWVGDFPETNLRTYVIGPDGQRGLWFLSMDAARLPVVAAARAAFRLPYVWSSMAVDARTDRVRYETRSRMFGAPRARSVIEVVPGAELVDERPLDRFLTARFRLYAQGPLGPYAVQVEHPRWRLRRASAVRLDDGLVAAAGFDVGGRPLVHYSDGVTVRVGVPEPVQRSS